MKRILLTFTLLLAGGTGFLALDVAARRAGQRLGECESAWTTQAQRLAELEAEKTALTTKLREMQLGLQAPSPAASSDLADLLDTNGLAGASPEVLEALRAELGLSWHSSGDWIVLSKATLAEVGMNALKGSNLTEAACGVLAITPEERRSLNDAYAETREEFAAWAKTSLQREGPNGDNLVRFTIPPNPELATTLSNKLSATVVGTLGQERAQLFQRYAGDWYKSEVGGLATMTNTLAVSLLRNGEPTPRLHYDFSVKGGPGQGSRGESGLIIPSSRYFPNAFQSVFPGGWRELAEREGIELPKESPKASQPR